MGLRLSDLGTPRLSWRDLLVIVNQSPPGSALWRSKAAAEDVDPAWGLQEQLLAGIFDVLRIGNWQRGGGKGQKPRLMPRPGVESGRVIGSDPIPISEFDHWWNEGYKADMDVLGEAG